MSNVCIHHIAPYALPHPALCIDLHDGITASHVLLLNYHITIPNLSTTNSLWYLVRIIPMFLLQLLDQCDVLCLRFIYGETFVDILLPGAFLGFSLFAVCLSACDPRRMSGEKGRCCCGKRESTFRSKVPGAGAAAMSSPSATLKSPIIITSISIILNACFLSPGNSRLPRHSNVISYDHLLYDVDDNEGRGGCTIKFQ